MAMVLGLDLGPNSVGWALVDEQKQSIVGTGVRIFPEGVDNFDTGKEASRNDQRRTARQMRRQHQRRRNRKRLLREALVEAGLLPREAEEQKQWLAIDPYPLRAKAVQEKLSPCELGRLFYHLSQRRGFLSLRKKERKDNEVAGMLAEIQQNEQERSEKGHATVGAMLAEKHALLDHRDRTDNDHVRDRHLARAQIEHEFDVVWERQRELGHEQLTDVLKYGKVGRQSYPVKPVRLPADATPLEAFGLHGLIFFQRPIYWPASVVGRCTLEPRHRRCPRADRRAQRFRMLQEVNNLRFIDPDTNDERPLSEDQRRLLLEKLSTCEKMTFDAIRKALGFLESVRFNLEGGGRSKLQGMVTDAVLASTKHIGPAWHKLDDRDKDRIVRNLIESVWSDEQLEARLIERFGFTPEQAEGAVVADLPAGHMEISLAAINQLLPHLERGLRVMGNDASDSALHAAGYLRRDEQQRAVMDALPGLKDPASPLPDIPNPVVKRAIVELRKVVNAIVREFGKPDAIHLEMARQVQQSGKRRKDHNRKIREREADREKAADEIRTLGEKVTGEKVLRYLLWQEQARECPYTGRPIALRQLFGGETDVDHILPRSRSLDNAQMNKVLVFRDANREKGQRTVHQWLADSDPARYEQICQRARKLPYPKYRRFLQKEAHLDNFIARQLSDTGYLSRATGQYLQCLYDDPKHVLGLKGQLTSTLRHQWGLETVLADLEDSPAWAHQANLRPGEKNRADHRHHAVDAVVVALINRSRLQQLARGMEDHETVDQETGEVVERRSYRAKALDEPWPNFRNDVQAAIGAIRVSHRPERKVAGALHEDTFYGPTQEPGVWSIRKPVADLGPEELMHVRDEGIKRCLLQRLEAQGIAVRQTRPKRGRPKTSFVDARADRPATVKQVKAALADPNDPPRMPSGVPIYKVKVLRREQTIRPIRVGSENEAYVKPGATHHLAFFEWEEKGKMRRDIAFISMLEAIDRVKRRETVIQRTPPKDHPRIPAEASFLFSLSRGETVLANVKGQEKLLVYQTSSSTQGKLRFAEHTDARRSAERRAFFFTASTLDARKVTVDPIGRVRWASD